MAERLHPGVYTEERRRGVAPIQGVSTSNYGTVGFTTRGPTNVVQLVTSFEQFQRIFGGFTTKGALATHLFAFFANGGRRAYVNRVVASDAVSAAGVIGNRVIEDVIETGDGTTKSFSGTITKTPIRPETLSIVYHPDGTPVTAQDVTTTTSPTPNNTALNFAGRIVVTDDASIVPGSVTISTSITGPATVVYTDTAADGLLKDVGGDTRGYIDYVTGFFSLSAETGNAPDTATTITADYTPVGDAVTVTDDGAGLITGTTLTSGTIDYETGAYTFVVSVSADAPSNLDSIQASFIQDTFPVTALSEGEWGNEVEISVSGNEDSFVRATGTYSKFDVAISLPSAGVVENFAGLVFDDPADTNYVVTVINDAGIGSKLITLTDPSNADANSENLSGVSRTRSVGAGNGAAATNFGSTTTSDPDGFPAIAAAFRGQNLQTPVQPGSISITFTFDGGAPGVITDDGNGNLIGDVDSGAPVGYNKVDYTTGKYAFALDNTISEAETSHAASPTGLVPGSLTTIQYVVASATTANEDVLADGTDGVAAIGRNQLTNPSLKADRKGMYQLLVADELLNVGIPDAAGNVTMATDQVTEAETNGKWFIILAPTPGLSPLEVKNWRRNTLGISSSYAALYYPYIKIADPITNRGTNIPPIGHVAGVYARTDTNKSVGKAPAGTEDGKLLFSIGLERKIEFAEIDTFFQSQVNAIVDTVQTGRCVWGARTLENPPDDFRYIHVRRLFNFLKASIFNSTHGFVFENVGATLRQRIQITAESFLRNLYNQGLFKGTSPSEAFLVICDETNNTSDDEEAGVVICDLYVAVNKPGEFVVFRLQQKAAQAA